MGDQGDYCAFTKAVEHLGDRWSLVIVRELVLRGTLGFNALADGMPGISRSVLAARLRHLEMLGLVTRETPTGKGVPGYVLTYAGQELRPVLRGLWTWSLRFVPEDPEMIERDPDVVIMWLARRLDQAALPDQRAVIEHQLRGGEAKKGWIVVERGAAPSICIEDPCLAGDRYVFVISDIRVINQIARGMRTWAEAIDDGSVELFGEPSLVQALPSWFGLPSPFDAAATAAEPAPVA